MTFASILALDRHTRPLPLCVRCATQHLARLGQWRGSLVIHPAGYHFFILGDTAPGVIGSAVRSKKKWWDDRLKVSFFFPCFSNPDDARVPLQRDSHATHLLGGQNVTCHVVRTRHLARFMVHFGAISIFPSLHFLLVPQARRARVWNIHASAADSTT
jgi:hypothetical protein